jgi:RNA polymerase sigma-70 factor (ECF subfamily)
LCVFAGDVNGQELWLNAEVENKLVAAAREGEKAAYARLVETYSGRVFAISLGILGDRHEAEDVSQQAFLRGFMRIRTLRKSERFGSWIGRIARNLCLDAVRRRRRPPVVRPSYVDPADHGPEDYRRLEAALARLSPNYRVPLLLFYFDGRSTKSIAETLGATQGAVQARLSRARKQLRSLMEAEEAL